MNKTPKISVVIPFYNAEKFLEQAVNSVLKQKFSDYEIILIDDGSSDQSVEIAKQLVSSYPNKIKMISIKNSGPGIARNQGVNVATGKYLLFLDADDEFAENALQNLYNKILNDKSDLVIGLHQMINSKGQIIKEHKSFDKIIIDNTEAVKAVLEYKIIPTSWAKLYRTEIVKTTKFPGLFWKEDDVFLLDYLSKIKKISLLNETILINKSRTDSLTRQLICYKMVSDFFTSYELQQKYIPTMLMRLYNRQKRNTLLLLFLLLKIDWYKINNKEKIISELQNQAKKLLKTSRQNISFKQKLVLQLLNASNFLGIKTVLKIFAILKKNKISELRSIRN